MTAQKPMNREALRYTCPTCHARPGDKCMILGSASHRTTYTPHVGRLEKYMRRAGIRVD